MGPRPRHHHSTSKGKSVLPHPPRDSIQKDLRSVTTHWGPFRRPGMEVHVWVIWSTSQFKARALTQATHLTTAFCHGGVCYIRDLQRQDEGDMNLRDRSSLRRTLDMWHNLFQALSLHCRMGKEQHPVCGETERIKELTHRNPLTQSLALSSGPTSDAVPPLILGSSYHMET